ncbi:MAG: hypothetical protein MK137_09610 [Rickettsiales bacterium]|nr:hypothetical protein [Rickettsiales bacterium]
MKRRGAMSTSGTEADNSKKAAQLASGKEQVSHEEQKEQNKRARARFCCYFLT